VSLLLEEFLSSNSFRLPREEEHKAHLSLPLITAKNTILSFSYPLPLGRVVGAAILGGLEIPHDQLQDQTVLITPHQDGTKQGWRCSHSTCWCLGDLGPLSRGCSQQVSPPQTFLGHFGHMAEPTELGFFDS